VPDPTALKALADAGGWTVALTTWVFIAIGLWKRWWVPGWLWFQERTERLKSDAQAEANAKAIIELVGSGKDIRRAVRSIDGSLVELLGRMRTDARHRGGTDAPD
jgi:hypothetical protein